ncbi:hypothetical protein ACJX0J_007750 [Zea mays]
MEGNFFIKIYIRETLCFFQGLLELLLTSQKILDKLSIESHVKFDCLVSLKNSKKYLTIHLVLFHFFACLIVYRINYFYKPIMLVIFLLHIAHFVYKIQAIQGQLDNRIAVQICAFEASNGPIMYLKLYIWFLRRVGLYKLVSFNVAKKEDEDMFLARFTCEKIEKQKINLHAKEDEPSHMNIFLQDGNKEWDEEDWHIMLHHCFKALSICTLFFLNVLKIT